ncbi:hypothetical protein VOLCADRAFT_88142 [Volvox carteri f. nagariensis]|uniref:Endonuclease/exonuclease/phosphatase domain-containing protein n=1 Tax=Volvox carteri f. nagariensis TaxID=3068 RepID=D8TNE0_VOLCA|nr:uncharacterized protein VOLCADRAFT_88142 [Volvox carteri f. nagariensis]EFJ50976.1 hypothetical protein VOLCADRAFT_88142 [Volvox carteri f. nagariensis]|eukprot:XP_002947988.1 hypothetical protein VOLCADRAFT_88142 [Volvox carteri f. nagariensis]
MPSLAVMAAAGKTSAPQHSISVMTYNILAQKYAQSGWHNYCRSRYLNWKYRKALLLQELETYDSDIICLQASDDVSALWLSSTVSFPPEVEVDVFSRELQPRLAERGYRGHYLARAYGENVQGPLEGVALFYRTSVFELLQQRSFTFSSADTNPPAPLLPPGLSSSDGEEDVEATPATADAIAADTAPATSATGSTAAATVAADSEADSDLEVWAATADGGVAAVRARAVEELGAIMALLKHRRTKRRVLAAVTHLFWNPAYPDVKAFQAAVLCGEMAAFLRQHAGGSGGGTVSGGHDGVSPGPAGPSDDVSVVLAGDFNSLCRKRVPDVFDPKIPRGRDGLVSGVYTLLTRGSLSPHHPDHPASRRRPGETSNPDFRGVELTTAGFKLASAYCLANGRDPPLTTRTATFAGCLDYIFVSPQHFDVTETLGMPYDMPYGAVRDPLSDVAFPPIPNEVFPSDHVSLVAMLRFKS